jgi:hypothetical protein
MDTPDKPAFTHKHDLRGRKVLTRDRCHYYQIYMSDTKITKDVEAATQAEKLLSRHDRERLQVIATMPNAGSIHKPQQRGAPSAD